MQEHEQNPLNQDPSGDKAVQPDAAAAASGFTPEFAMQALQADLAGLKTKNAELTESYLRAKAEAENARRRAEEEVSKARKFAVESFAESLLPVTDSLEAGLLIKDASNQQIREGAEATLKQLKSALERNKVLEIAPAAGTKFDPTSTKPSAWCQLSKKPIPWSAYFKRATPLPTGCCALPW